MTSDDVSRRRVLRASSGVLGAASLGRVGASDSRGRSRCEDASVRPDVVHYDAEGQSNCADDHPTTRKLKSHVADALEERYGTVGALIDAGYLPYFDLFTANRGSGVSHWLNPEYIGDRSMLNPTRPESVLVDHRWWRPIGAMFVATRSGRAANDPPDIYTEDEPCLPWHAHVDLAGRYAWWKYRALYGDDPPSSLPCRTPWMMHVWAYPHPSGVYAHAAPPRGSRGGGPAEPAGFETDAEPGEDPLSWEVLPDALKHRVRHR